MSIYVNKVVEKIGWFHATITVYAYSYLPYLLPVCCDLPVIDRVPVPRASPVESPHVGVWLWGPGPWPLGEATHT